MIREGGFFWNVFFQEFAGLSCFSNTTAETVTFLLGFSLSGGLTSICMSLGSFFSSLILQV